MDKEAMTGPLVKRVMRYEDGPRKLNLGGKRAKQTTKKTEVYLLWQRWSHTTKMLRQTTEKVATRVSQTQVKAKRYHKRLLRWLKRRPRWND